MFDVAARPFPQIASWLIWSANLCALLAGTAYLWFATPPYTPPVVIDDAIDGIQQARIDDAKSALNSLLKGRSDDKNLAGFRTGRSTNVPMVLVPAGNYLPFFKIKTAPAAIPVARFLLDREPVSRQDFLDFVARMPAWRRSQVKGLFAEKNYLADWPSDLDAGEAPGKRPVTYVSWFAARSYCAEQGKRLPTVAEWELAAGKSMPAATPQNEAIDATPRSSAFAFAMGRTSKIVSKDSAVFGSVWEWTRDFNSVLVSGRLGTEEEGTSSLFCGDGFRSNDASDYAAFLRYSFRSSLKGNFALSKLGFRCAKDAP